MGIMRGVLPRSWVWLGIGAAGQAVAGALYAAATGLHPFGAANPVVYVMALFLVGFLVMHTVRAGEVYSDNWGAFFGLILATVFILSAAIAHAVFDGLGLFASLRERLSTGVTLFGTGSFALRGWLLLVIWVVADLILAFAGMAVGLMEGEKTFCESCRTTASRPRWKATVRGISEDDLASIRAKGLIGLLDTPAIGGPRQIEIRLRTCKCGACGAMQIKGGKAGADGSWDDVRNNDLVAPLSANSVIAWANSCPDATCDPDPGLALHDRAPFTRPIRPDGAHFRSKMRWNNAMGASDSYCDNEYTTELRSRLALGDYEAIPEALALAPDPNDRGFIYEAAADWEKRPAFLDQWERDEPDCPVRLTVEGIFLVKAAWLARGSGWNVKNAGGFFAHLESSMASLHRAVEIDPNESAAWAWQIYTAKGLQWSPDQVRPLYDRAASIAPAYRQPASMHLDYLAPKWHGDKDSYLRFAREAAARAPRGSTLPVLIAEAHIEMSTGLGRPGATDKGAAYWSQPGVAAEVMAANRQCFTDHKECMDSARTRVFFAYALWKCGCAAEAAEHLRIIGKSTPWGPFQAPIPILAKDTIKKARRACGL